MSADTNNHLPPDGDSPDDLQTLAGQYVLGTQDAAQRRAIEERLPHDPALREMHFGAWEMRRFDEIEAETPDHIRAFWETPGDVRPPGGESWHQMTARLEGALVRIRGWVDDRDGPRIEVTHPEQIEVLARQ